MTNRTAHSALCITSQQQSITEQGAANSLLQYKLVHSKSASSPHIISIQIMVVFSHHQSVCWAQTQRPDSLNHYSVYFHTQRSSLLWLGFICLAWKWCLPQGGGGNKLNKSKDYFVNETAPISDETSHSAICSVMDVFDGRDNLISEDKQTHFFCQYEPAVGAAEQQGSYKLCF